MARWNDNAPVGNTCPKIDDVISTIQNLTECDINDENDFFNMSKEIQLAVNVMENIRSDNSELREWGNELFREKSDLENTVYDLEQRINESENKNLKYSYEIKELEVKIIDLES